MSKKPKVIVIRTAGTNCDLETAYAFKQCGAIVDSIHINRLINGEVKLDDYQILAIPGGFTYGDDIESGRLLANELCLYLGTQIQKFIRDRKLIIGICNGFQVLVKAGILPGPLTEVQRMASDYSQKVTLTNNDSGKFEDRWTFLRVSGESVWTNGLERNVYFPVAHAEGKFVTLDNKVLSTLDNNGQVAFRYATKAGTKPRYPQNPNGSMDDIAGITDSTGRILGLMPHPERHFFSHHHPSWTRSKSNGRYGDGAHLFKNGVEYVKEHLS